MAIDTSYPRAWRTIRKKPCLTRDTDVQRFSEKIVRKQQTLLVARHVAKCSQQKPTRARARVGLALEKLFGSAHAARTGTGAAAAATSTTLRPGTCAEYRFRLHRQEALALQLLAGKLARAAHGLGLFTGLLLGGLFIVTAELHLAEDALSLHFLLQRLEGLIDVVIANENLHAASSFQISESGNSLKGWI